VYLDVVPGNAIAVRTGNAVVRITGTILDVRAAPAQTDVVLLEGSAQFAAADAASQWVNVPGGCASSVKGGGRPSLPSPVDAAARVHWVSRLEGANALAEFLLHKVPPQQSAMGPGVVQPRQAPSEPAEATVVPELADSGPVDLNPLLKSEAPSGTPSGGLSDADLATARSVVSRYAANFAKMSSLSFHREQSAWRVSQDGSRSPLRALDVALDVEVTRQPPYLQVSGKDGDGRAIEETVTPVGRVSNGYYSAGENQVPFYMDGEVLFRPGDLLERADRVQTDSAMTKSLPGLQDYVDAHRGSRYDVLALTVAASGTSWEFWFNRESGLVDFAICYAPAVSGKELALREAAAVEYQIAGGGLYWRRWELCDYSTGIEQSNEVTRLLVNGGPADGVGSEGS